MQNHFTILVIEDEPAIRQLLETLLKNAHYDVILCEDTQASKDILTNKKVDLILLDWMLPKTSGIDFIKKLKRDPSYKKIPVIMLTARAEENCKLDGLNEGADDYITKPFSPKELLARIKTVLRRQLNIDVDYQLERQEIKIDFNAHTCHIAGKLTNLTPMSFKLLQFLLTQPNIVHSRSSLLDKLWGNEKEISERAIDAEIKRLRKALGSKGELIQAIRGTGYIFHA